MARKSLLAAGILASLLYVAMNVVVAMQWPDYSSAEQTVSELSAIGAPTRRLWIALGIPYALLMTAFGGGVRLSAGPSRPLRAAGDLLIAYGLVSLFWPLAPMHLRGDGFTLTDTMHIAFAMASVLLMFLAVGCAAAALGARFRLYSAATVVVLLAFGTLTSLAAPRVAAGLPTPRLGIWERVDIGGFLLWVVVLAIALLRGRARLPGNPSAH